MRVAAIAADLVAARLAVVGCYATLSPQACADLPGVIWVVSNGEKERTVEIVAPYSSSAPYPCKVGGRTAPFRTRAFVKVQDGCDNHCTYCIVRSLRGPGRSRPLDDVVAEVQALVDGTLEALHQLFGDLQTTGQVAQRVRSPGLHDLQ